MNPRQEEFVPDGHLLATWWRQLSPGTYYWRNVLPARFLPGQVLDLKTRDLQPSDHEIGVQFPRQMGVAVWPFAANATRGALMAAQQELGYRVLLEADDNYFIPPPTMGRGWQLDFDRTGNDNHSFKAHARIAEWVDGVIVSTEPLAELYGQVNQNIYLCPNQTDPADWDEPEKPQDGVLRVGWAASHSHIPDVPLVRRALAKAADHPNTHVLVYGLADVVKFPGRVRRVGWTDTLADYRRSMQQLDVGICPLVETPWSVCKSAIKAYEYALCAALPIVQDSIVYEPYQGPTIRCRTASDWQEALRWCVNHPDEARQMGREARAYVLEHHDIRDHMRPWREAICRG